MSVIDPYLVLGIPSGASDREIKSAYRKHARLHHPDVGGDPDEFKKTQEAYSLIGDPVKRAVYDLERRQSGVSNAKEEALQITREYMESMRKRQPR